MYKYIIILFLMPAIVFSQEDDILELGQEDEKQQTLLDSEYESGGYGGPELILTEIMDKKSMLIGARGGWIIGNILSIGGAGYILLGDNVIENYNQPEMQGYDSTVYLRMAYGGMFMEYINNSNKIVHFTVNALVGFGGASYTGSIKKLINMPEEKQKDWNLENSTFFVFSPGISVDVNILPFFRLSAGASYRLTGALDLSRTDTNDLNSYNIFLMLKFGKF